MSLFAVFRRELASYFLTPLGWVVMALFLLVQGYGFYLLVELVAQPYAPHGAVLRLFFGGTLIYWLFFIVVVCSIAMRLIAEERHSGTLETLLTAPVSERAVILGKYAAAVAFFSALWVPTSVYVLLVWQMQGDPPLDPGPVAAGYLGTVVIGAACIAVGTMCSTLFQSQIVAGLASFALLVLLLLIEPLQQLVYADTLRKVAEHISLFGHMEEFSRGIVDTRRLVLHGSLAVFCLTVAVKSLERR